MKMSFLILALVMLTGCIQFTRPGGTTRTVKDMNAAEQVQALEITEIRPVLVRKAGCCMLSLEAAGQFVKHVEKTTTYNVSGRRHILAVGLFPGTWACPGMDITFVWVVPISAAIVNTFTLGYPTWNALFIEPFRDYHDAIAGLGIETWGFMGCRKYLDFKVVAETERDFKTEDESCKVVVLKGYAVVVGGVSYTADGNGFVKLPDFPRGSSVKIEIIAPPLFSKESKETGNELLGLVLECRCQ